MNKKLLSILSILFLTALLSISCSNQDKTGSGGDGIDSKWRGDYYGSGYSVVVGDSGGIMIAYNNSYISFSSSLLKKEADNHYRLDSSEYSSLIFDTDKLTIIKSDGSQIILKKATVQ